MHRGRKRFGPVLAAVIQKLSKTNVLGIEQANPTEPHRSGTRPLSASGNPNLQPTTFGGLTRADLMSRVRSKGNKTTEKLFATFLKKAKITGWRRHQALIGKPDFVWRSAKLALFLDGCFWHGHACRNTSPKTNAAIWRNKFAKTRIRDRRITTRLRANGWTVVRIWECELATGPEKCLTRVRRSLAATAADAL
jgi:DNA mismatch endonuclease, patch repair protein